MKTRPLQPDRSKIDLSDTATMRGWSRKLRKSPAEIAAAVEKVGGNAETVKKELGVSVE